MKKQFHNRYDICRSSSNTVNNIIPFCIVFLWFFLHFKCGVFSAEHWFRTYEMKYSSWYPEMLSPYPQCFSHFSYLFFEKWTLSSHTLLTVCKGLPLYPCVAEEALHFTRYWSNSSKQFVQSYHSLLFSQCSCPNEVNIKLFFFSWRIRLYIFFTMFNEWIPSS